MLDNFIARREDNRLAYLMGLADEEREEQRSIVAYRDYYGGEHEVELTERQKEFLNGDGKSTVDFRLNQCPVVVESLVERLKLNGFEEIGEEQAGLIDFASSIWEFNRMDAGQEEVYRQAAIDRVTFIVLDVDPETGEITLNHHDAFTSGEMGGDNEGVKIHYRTRRRRGRPIFATKRWAIDQGSEAGYRRHLVVYYPDRIERYYQDDREADGGQYGEAGWRPEVAESGPLAGVWPQPWIDEAGRPLGLPVIPFVNGRASELHEVIPIQRALNKAMVDLIAAADQAGFGILFAAGWVPTTDGLPLTMDADGDITSGNEPLSMEPGAIFFTTNEQGSLVRVAGDDLAKLIQVVDKHIISVAQVSRTPISNFQLFGQVPAEGTQRQLESGLLAKAASRQRVYGNAWEDVVYMARRMALGMPVFAGGQVVGFGLERYREFGLDNETRLSALWADAETRNEREHLETLRIKRELGVPLEQIFLEAGYDAAQAERFAMEAESQRLAGLAMTLDPSPSPSPIRGGEIPRG